MKKKRPAKRQKSSHSCWRDSRGRPKARGHFAMPDHCDSDGALTKPSAVGRPVGESMYDSELDAMENG